MLIRTQDKKSLIDIAGAIIEIKELSCLVDPFDTGNAFHVYGDTFLIEASIPVTSHIRLGEYSSKEKALYVLDMIHAKHILDFKVFEMPADDEVNVWVNQY